jgi:hypothetical protein
MALTKTVTLKNSFGESSVFGDAYMRVDRIDGDKRNVVVQVGFYKEENGRLLLSEFIPFAPDLAGGNFIKQAYEHLKTLPEFSLAL